MAKKKAELALIDPGKDFPSLNDLLVKNDKKGLFHTSTASLGMPTGFLPLDYRNGYKVSVFGADDTATETYNNIGIFSGTFNTIIGKTGTAKTTLAAQMAANISRYCERTFGIPAEIYHLDAEQASNITRIKNITGYSINELKSRYHLNQESTYIEDIYEIARSIVNLKEAYKDHFTVNTPYRDEFGDPIRMFVPTIMIIDSLPSISTREGEKSEELQTGTYANRIAKAISRFYKQMMPIVKRYNFIVFVINHINKKIEIGGMPTSPQTMYLKMDETIPCGFAPLYYAHNIFKIVVDGKLKEEKDGIDGFRARIELLKSRSNKAGKSCHLIYNQETGFDSYLSLYEYLNEEGMVEGRNPYRYIKGFEDIKFDDRKFREEMQNNPKLYDAVYSVSIVSLENLLSKQVDNSGPSASDVTLLYNSLRTSYEEDKSFDK